MALRQLPLCVGKEKPLKASPRSLSEHRQEEEEEEEEKEEEKKCGRNHRDSLQLQSIVTGSIDPLSGTRSVRVPRWHGGERGRLWPAGYQGYAINQ